MIDGSGVELTPGELQDDLRTVVDSRVEHWHLLFGGEEKISQHPVLGVSWCTVRTFCAPFSADCWIQSSKGEQH